MAPYCSPNRYLVAIAALLVVMAISITVAVLFPYQDLNAESAAAAAAGGVGIGVGGAPGVVVDDAVDKDVNSGSANSAMAEVAKPPELQTKPVEISGDGESSGSSGQSVEAMAEVAKPPELQTEPAITTSGGSGDDSSAKTPADESSDTSDEAKHNMAQQPGSSSGSNLSDEPAESEAHHSLFDHGDSAAAPASALEDSGVDASPADSVTTPENDDTSCLSILQQADVDANDMLDSSEYIGFLDNLQRANRLGSDVAIGKRYIDLPFSVKVNYANLSCKCPPSKPNCCAYGDGIYIGQEAEAGEGGLDVICDKTVGVEWRDVDFGKSQEGA